MIKVTFKDGVDARKELDFVVSKMKSNGWKVDNDGDLTLEDVDYNRKAWMRPMLHGDGKTVIFGIVRSREYAMTKALYSEYHCRVARKLLNLVDNEIGAIEISSTFVDGQDVWKDKTEGNGGNDVAEFKVGDVVIFNDVELGKRFGVITDKGIDYDFETLGFASGTLYDLRQVIRLATPEEIAKWNKDVLEPNRLHYSTSKRKIVDWFMPFDKVITRCYDDASYVWKIGFFDQYRGGYYWTIGGDAAELCLPYNEKTAKLIGTTDDYEEE